MADIIDIKTRKTTTSNNNVVKKPQEIFIQTDQEEILYIVFRQTKKENNFWIYLFSGLLLWITVSTLYSIIF